MSKIVKLNLLSKKKDTTNVALVFHEKAKLLDECIDKINGRLNEMIEALEDEKRI